MAEQRVTTVTLREMKKRGEKIAMLTAYDYPTARILDESGIEVLLVGDSLGMVVLGYPTTIPVTMEEMLHHTKAVSRGTKRALVVGDMPFMSYQASIEEALRNAGRFLKEGDVQAVKLEGGREVLEVTSALVRSGIPVMSHIGLTPQHIHRFGGFKVQGKTASAAAALLDDAIALEEAGAFALVLEGIPSQVAKVITERVGIPTIGIGAGPFCDGQVLVTHDLLGLFNDFAPKFLKRYANLKEAMTAAFQQYRNEVKEGKFPAPEHAYGLDPAEARALESLLEKRVRSRRLFGR